MKITLITYQPSVKQWLVRIDGGVFDVEAIMMTDQLKKVPDYLKAIQASPMLTKADEKLAKHHKLI